MDTSNIHQRTSHRLSSYDYSSIGYYFVTICTDKKRELFGHIKNGSMTLSSIGETIKQAWEHTPKIRTHVSLDLYQIMPNHIHGIISIHQIPVRAYAIRPYKKGRISPSQTIGSIIRGIKASTTKQISETHVFPFPVWQRNYYEHIIRSEQDLLRIREYIVNNPLQWDIDEENSHILGAHIS